MSIEKAPQGAKSIAPQGAKNAAPAEAKQAQKASQHSAAEKATAEKAPAETQSEKGLRNTKFIAQYCKLTERRIQQLTTDGVLVVKKRTKDGNLYEFLPNIQRYLIYLQDKVKNKTRATEDKEAAKLDAEIKYKESKAEYAKLELEELKGKMHRAEDVAALVADLAATTKSMLMGLPGRLAMDVITKQTAAEASVVIEDALGEVLSALAAYEYDPEFFRERVAEREGWTVDEQDENDD